MKRDPVKSATIRSIGYEAETETLEIEFHRRGTYQYIGVPELLFRGLMLSDSKGTFFNTRIANRYLHREAR